MHCVKILKCLLIVIDKIGIIKKWITFQIFWKIKSAHYNTIREELIKRNWAENHDPDSEFFNLKYTTLLKEITLQKIIPGQIINHQYGTNTISTKIGLLKNLSL